MLASMLGTLLLFIIFAVFGMMSLIGMVASGSKAMEVEDNTVLVVKLTGDITEQPSADDYLGTLFGDRFANQGLTDIVSAIEKAKDNDHIKGIYLEAGTLSAGTPTLTEIRQKLEEFKKAGKWIVAYGDSYTQGAYYVASVADKVYLNPQGTVDWHGVCSEPMYVKDLYAKFGVKYQVFKVGTFKSATEYYTETKMSDANRLQVKAYIDGLWSNICAAVAKSRHLTVEKLNQCADTYMAFQDAETAKKCGFADNLLYADQIKDEVRKLLDIDADDDISQVSVDEMKDVKHKADDGDEIAVYYAEGNIVSVAGSGLGESEIVSKTICDDLAELADNDDVKAVVLRVNSPGGDAYASEQIWRAVTQLKKKKPVVVSMGDYAASGGYYMSCGASWIVAQPTTLTGSIGIFAVIPDVSQLTNEKLGLHFDEVKTNRNSGFGNVMMRPFNDEECTMLQNYVNRGYALFVKRVADGRKQTTEYVNNIAQGRVWTGQDAIKNKLVDQLGGIDVAVAKAAQLAKSKEYFTSEYPAQKSFFDELLESTEGDESYISSRMKATLGTLYYPLMLLQDAGGQPILQARLPFEPNIR